MADFLRENFTGHPKLYPQMVMFILETMVPCVELEGVYADCDNVSALPVTVRNLVSSVDAFDSRLRALEDNAGFEVGGGAVLSINARRNQNRRNGANGEKIRGGIVDIP